MAVLVAPLAVNVSMQVAFRTLPRRFGRERGYLAAFGAYWVAWGFVFPLAVLGPKGLAAQFTRVRRPQLTDLALLLAPPVGGALQPKARATHTQAGVALALAFGIVNGLAEELLWRGVFVATFDDRLRGWLYPAVGFGAWHLAPQAVYASNKKYRFAFLATLLGLVYGEVARRTGGIAWTAPAHMVTDYLGTDLAWFSELHGGATRTGSLRGDPPMQSRDRRRASI